MMIGEVSSYNHICRERERSRGPMAWFEAQKSLVTSNPDNGEMESLRNVGFNFNFTRLMADKTSFHTVTMEVSNLIK
jgi:hypothetical protein